jgi:hypothetical protein
MTDNIVLTDRKAVFLIPITPKKRVETLKAVFDSYMAIISQSIQHYFAIS